MRIEVDSFVLFPIITHPVAARLVGCIKIHNATPVKSGIFNSLAYLTNSMFVNGLSGTLTLNTRIVHWLTDN